MQRIIADRVPDLRFLLNEMLARPPAEVADRIDEERIGLVGWSFGGWAVLSALEVDDRFGVVLALAPAANSQPLPGIIPATLTFAWQREVPALYLVAERDRFTPVGGHYELFERALSERMFILRGADHQHFADEIPEPGPCSPAQARLFTRSLGLAHFDAALKSNPQARLFMRDDLAAMLRERGVDAAEYPPTASI